MTYRVKLKDFFLVYIRFIFYQNLINDKYYQNFGFLYVLYPIIKNVQRTKKAIQKFIIHNFEYFNTNPYLVSFILGVAMRFVVERNEEKLRKFKFDIMAPLAALGDAISWQVLPSFLVLISSIMIFSKNYYGVLIFFIGFNIILNLGFRFFGLIIGYKNGLNVIFKIANMDIQNQLLMFKKVGLILWGSGLFLLLKYRYNFIDFSFHSITIQNLVSLVLLSGLIYIIYRINKMAIPNVTYLIYLILILIISG